MVGGAGRGGAGSSPTALRIDDLILACCRGCLSCYATLRTPQLSLGTRACHHRRKLDTLLTDGGGGKGPGGARLVASSGGTVTVSGRSGVCDNRLTTCTLIVTLLVLWLCMIGPVVLTALAGDCGYEHTS